MQLIDKMHSEQLLASGKVEYIPKNRRKHGRRGTIRAVHDEENSGKNTVFKIRAKYEKPRNPIKEREQIFEDGQTNNPRGNTTPRWAWEPVNNDVWQDKKGRLIGVEPEPSLDEVLADWVEELNEY